MGGDEAGEVVVRDREVLERENGAELRREVAGELLVGKRNSGDSVAAVAGDSGPAAGGRVGVGPGGEGPGRVGDDGGLEREERKAVGRERGGERNGEY